MGPSLRVRPHRPTYMRLQKDHQKPAKKKRRRRREMPRHPHPSRVKGVCIPPHPQASSPPIPHAETPTPSQQPAAPACLPPSPAARFPTRLLHQPNLVIRETIPTQNIQSDERDCPGLRVGPAHVVAHRYSLPNTTPAPLTHMCVVKEGCGLMSIYYVCCPKLPVYNDTTTKKRASSERFTQSLFINEKVMNNQLLF